MSAFIPHYERYVTLPAGNTDLLVPQDSVGNRPPALQAITEYGFAALHTAFLNGIPSVEMLAGVEEWRDNNGGARQEFLNQITGNPRRDPRTPVAMGVAAIAATEGVADF